MRFRNTYNVYRRGSIKEQVIYDENIKIKTYYYVKGVINGHTKYLRIYDGKNYKFTDFENATPLNMKVAIKCVNLLKKKNIRSSLYTSSKKHFNLLQLIKY